MATKAFWQLEKPITQVKHITFDINELRWVEDTYEDCNGDRAVISRPASLYERVRITRTLKGG